MANTRFSCSIRFARWWADNLNLIFFSIEGATEVHWPGDISLTAIRAANDEGERGVIKIDGDKSGVLLDVTELAESPPKVVSISLYAERCHKHIPSPEEFYSTQDAIDILRTL